MSPLPPPVMLALGKLPATPMLPDLRMKGQPVRGTCISNGSAGRKTWSFVCIGTQSGLTLTGLWHNQTNLDSGTIATIVGGAKAAHHSRREHQGDMQVLSSPESKGQPHQQAMPS